MKRRDLLKALIGLAVAPLPLLCARPGLQRRRGFKGFPVADSDIECLTTRTFISYEWKYGVNAMHPIRLTTLEDPLNDLKRSMTPKELRAEITHYRDGVELGKLPA